MISGSFIKPLFGGISIYIALALIIVEIVTLGLAVKAVARDHFRTKSYADMEIYSRIKRAVLKAQ